MRGKHISPVMTPDGPHGQRWEFKPGTIFLSEISSAPIVPMAYAAEKAKVLHSWDRYVLPMLFSRVVVAVGEPVNVKIGGDESAVDRLQNGLSQTLTDWYRQARHALESPDTGTSD